MQPSLGIMYALCFVAIAIAFAYAAYLIKWVRQQDPGNPQIVKVPVPALPDLGERHSFEQCEDGHRLHLRHGLLRHRG